jgi:hypothetical protein
MSPTPPRLARAIVSLASEPADRPWILADLDEEFATLAAVDLGRARRWYWRQAATSLVPLVRRRMRRRPPSVTPGRPDVLHSVRNDLRHALRVAARAPVPTAAIVMTMALGIGATAAVSTVVWKVLVQPLPMRESDRVLAVYRVLEQTGAVLRSVSYPDLEDWRRRTKSFVGLAPFTEGEGTVLADRGPVSVNGVQVGEDFFAVLGSRFALGRAFDRESFVDGAAPVVILSATMWEREFGRDSAIVGRAIRLATGPATVVGVVASGEFTLPLGGADLWMPLRVPTSGPTAWMRSRGTQWFVVVARVLSDVRVVLAM